MKLIAAAVPKGWRSRTLPDGTVRVSVPKLPLGWLTAVSAFALLSPALQRLNPSTDLIHWSLFLGIFGLGSLVWYQSGEQSWLLSPAGLQIRFRTLGITWRQQTFPFGELSVAASWDNVWVLLLHHKGKTQRLYRHEGLTDVLGLSTLLQTALGWREVEQQELPPYVHLVVYFALATDNPDPIRNLLDEPQGLSLLTRLWRNGGTHYRPQLFSMLIGIETQTGQLSGLADTGPPESQACAIEILSVWEDARVLPVLRRALTGPAIPVRWRAIWGLGRQRDGVSVSALCDAVRTTPELRQVGAWALGEIGDPAAFSTLTELLASTAHESEAAPRQAAATALGKLKDPAAVPALSCALEDRIPAVRESAAAALALIGDPSGVAALLRAIGDPELSVAIQIVAALGRIGDAAALPDLCRLIADGESELRAGAATALGQIGGTAAVEALCRILDDPDASVRFRVVSALYQVAGSAKGVPFRMRAAIPLLQALSGPLSRETADLRQMARKTLQRIEAGTGKTKQLPLPSEGIASDSAHLPLPAVSLTLETEREVAEVIGLQRGLG